MSVRRAFALVTLLALAACGGSSPAGPGGDGDGDGNGSGPITGTVNGTSWTSSATYTTMIYTASTHSYSISTSDGAARAMAIVFSDIQAAGTFALASSAPFRYANVVIGNSAWETAITNSNSGQLTIEIATPTRLKGHMNYTGTPASSAPGTTGTATVNVSFDLTTTSTN